jgi:hypothetical protein
MTLDLPQAYIEHRLGVELTASTATINREVEKQGLMEYWRATKTQPVVCETEDVPFCRELKAVKP